MTRKLIESVYYWTALAMPLWWEWQWVYTIRARGYFEAAESPGFVGWPWKWSPP